MNYWDIDHHTSVYTCVKSICCVPYIYTILSVKCISIFKMSNKKKKTNEDDARSQKQRGEETKNLLVRDSPVKKVILG